MTNIMDDTQQNGSPGGAQSAAQETVHQAAEEGSALLGATAEGAKDLTNQARQQLSTVGAEAKDQARQALSTTTDEVQNQLEQRLGDATEMARSRAGELRALAEGRPDEAGSARDLALKASERLESVADRVDELGVRGMVNEVSDFARQRPLVFLAGAATAGLLVGRLARAGRDASANSPSMPARPDSPLGTTRPMTPPMTPGMGGASPAPIGGSAPLGADPTSTAPIVPPVAAPIQPAVAPGPAGGQVPPPPPPPPRPATVPGPAGGGSF